MKIVQKRFGFATNSSSSHSIVYSAGLTDRQVDGDFGWGDFVCQSKKAKQIYFATALYQSVPEKHKESALKFIEKEYDIYFSTDNYVDHQSLIACPLDQKTSKPAYKFWKALTDPIITDSSVAVVGGNDNGDDYFEDYERAECADVLRILEDSRGWIIREDKKYYIMFNQNSGKKYTIEKETGDKLTSHRKSDTPELVDMKITNYCSNYGKCQKFCYQNSDWRGRHAHIDEIKKYIDVCSDMGVFEIAFGGGEPTSHPQFEEIIKYTRDKGMVPNFSTKDHRGLKDNIAAINLCVGGFAYSVGDITEILITKGVLIGIGANEYTVSYQYVLEAFSYQNYLDIIDILHEYNVRCSITLLGFKDVGKGKDFAKLNGDYSCFIKDAIDRKQTISIDTMLASKYEDALIAAGVDKVLYYTKEGAHSMYIDCVTHTCGESSFCTNMEPCVPEVKDIVSKFQKY